MKKIIASTVVAICIILLYPTNAYADQWLTLPFANKTRSVNLNGNYGAYRTCTLRRHSGIDLIGDTSDMENGIIYVYPSAPGTVVDVGNWGDTSFGRYVEIEHQHDGLKWFTLYAHLANPVIATIGQTVDISTRLGIQGATGDAGTPHVHLVLLQSATIPDVSPGNHSTDFLDFSKTSNPCDYMANCTSGHILIPNCKNLTGPSTLVKNKPYQFTATYENYYGPLTSGGIAIAPPYKPGNISPNCDSSNWITDLSSGMVPGTYTWTLTPPKLGTFTVFCDAWNDGIAECMGDWVDNEPRDYCPGPNAKMTITVVSSLPNQTSTPTPTFTPFSCNRCSTLNGCERTQFQSMTSDCAQPIADSTITRTTDCSCQEVSGGNNDRCAAGCAPTNTPTPILYSCNRCSTLNGCERTQFQSMTSDCAQPIADSTITRTTDCSCSQISGGNNDRCAAGCAPTNTPTPTPIPGDIWGPAGIPDGHVDMYDFDKMRAEFGNLYTIYNYNDLVSNFGLPAQ
jgi:hypothetical protein